MGNWDYLKYWQLWHHHFDGQDIGLIRELCPAEGKSILEVGCGDGRVTFALAPHCASITGVDKEERFIIEANKKLAVAGAANMKFLSMDAQNLSWESNSVDVVLFPWVLQMVPNPTAAVKEAHRVLKPGGQLLIIGLRSNADYDQIIAQFADAGPEIDPLFCYEQPLKQSFGTISQMIAGEKGTPFGYEFESPDIAFDAFLFALDYWYKTRITVQQEAQLKLLISKYTHNGKVRIDFPASIYLASKE